MAIGSAIILAALGAILAFGVDAQLAGLDLQVIGYILMAAGIIGAILGLVARNNRDTTHHHHTDSAPRGGHGPEQRTA